MKQPVTVALHLFFPAVNQAECTVGINVRICASELGLLCLVLICYVNIRNGVRQLTLLNIQI